MTGDHDAVRLLLGAYVLGGLDATDRQRVQDHLPGCETCRDELARAAPLPGLLRRLSPGQFDRDRTGAAGPPADLLGALLAEVRRDQRAQRRRIIVRSLAAAAAVAAVLAAGIGFTLSRDTPSSSVLVLTGSGGQTAGEAQLTTKPWGTALSVRVVGLPGDGPFTLEVTGVDGARQRAASWGPTPTGAAEVAGATSISPEQITTVEVRGPDGTLLTGDAAAAAAAFP